MTTEIEFRDPIILIDGSSYLYRAYHALPQLSTASGQPTGAIKGVLSMLRKLIDEYSPSHIAVVFDAKGKNFRHEKYPQYKSHRPPMPDILQQQIAPLYKIIRALGLPLLVIDGVEADDVIGTLAHQAQLRNLHAIIATGDKDFAQVVNPYISLLNTMNNTRMDENGVKEKFGIAPNLIIDLLALMGDKVDNVPGVPGIGEKSALQLLQHIGGIEELYARIDEVGKLPLRGSETWMKKLKAHEAEARLARELVTIKLDVELPISLDELTIQNEDRESLKKLYHELEFKTWLHELEKEKTVPAPAAKRTNDNYQIILTENDFFTWLKKLEAAELFSFDTETTGVNYMQAELVGVSFAVQAHEAAYIPLMHDYDEAPKQLSRDWVLEKLKPLLENPQAKKVGQNLKYDQSILVRYDIQLQGIAYDTMLESYLVNSTAGRHDMDSLAVRYLATTTTTYEDIAGKGVKQKTFNQIPLEVAGPYAAEDADITLQLHQNLWPKLEEHSQLKNLFEMVELPLLSLLSKIERQGTLIDVEKLQQQSGQLTERLKELEQEAFLLAGEEFNLSSTQQLGKILFEKLQIPVIQKTPKGAPSTAEPVLQELAMNYPLPKLLLEYRSLIKLKSTYTDKLPEQIDPQTHRIHTSYHQAVTATGRLSSADPNLQNIPIRTLEGRRIRQAFIAPNNWKIIAADYSQIELRIMAHLSEDKGLIHAFEHNQDVHRATASEVFSTPLEVVSAEQRRHAKAINFGLLYGMGAFGLAKQLNVNRHEAQIYIDKYFERYPGVHQFMERIRRLAHEKGFVETLLGRRLYLPEIHARNKQLQLGAERAAINAPMQGTAADIIKLAMLRVDKELTAQGMQTRIVMQVHDELVFESPLEEIESAKLLIQTQMSQALQLKVPLIVDLGVGDNWDEAH